MKNYIKTVSLFAFCALICNFIFIGAKDKPDPFSGKNKNKGLIAKKLEQEYEKEFKIKTKETNMKINEIKEYSVKQELKPAGLVGISDDQINDHWKLYEGYVKQVNVLNAELKQLAQEGKVDSLVYADRRRRYGFEYNGMILHEYYFGNLKAGSKDLSLSEADLKKAIEQTWGSFDKWKEDFIATGKTRGIGWAILYMDPQSKNLTNHFISEHQNGVIAGFTPILVMDVWEHAYMVDHGATERGKYIDAFLQNVNWEVAESRFSGK